VAEGPVDKLTAHVVQNYQITGEISRDAMSRLFQATSPSLGSAVIIQVIPGELVRDPEFADRFQSRMRKAASLAHRNILHVNHFSHEDPNYYLVLDYFDGRSLAQVMAERGRLPVPDVINYLSQALEALDHAHKNGIAHGALHPGGILVADDGELRMTGFGIAKAIDPQSMLVETVANPYPYKSPEQAMGLPVDARSDLYSLGLIVWQALAGRLPQGEEPPPISTVNEDAAPELEEVMNRMLVPRPRDRFRTARQVAIALSGAKRASRAKPRQPVVERPAAPAAPPVQAPVEPHLVSAEVTAAPPAGSAPAPQAGAAAAAAAPAPTPPAVQAGAVPAADQGIMAYRQGSMDDAVRLLEEAAEAMPRSVRVLAHLGAAYYAAKRYADAALTFGRALQVRPDLSTLRYDLGNALLAQGKVAEARREFQKAWDQDPRCTAALLMLVSLEAVSPSL
jgi:tetratricopeptide (TPR) repeat protein